MSYTIALNQITFTAEDPVTVARTGAKNIVATKMRSGALKIDDYGIASDGIMIYGVHANSNTYSEFADLDNLIGEQVTLAGMHDTNFNGLYRLANYTCRVGAGRYEYYNYQIHLEKV